MAISEQFDVLKETQPCFTFEVSENGEFERKLSSWMRTKVIGALFLEIGHWNGLNNRTHGITVGSECNYYILSN